MFKFYMQLLNFLFNLLLNLFDSGNFMQCYCTYKCVAASVCKCTENCVFFVENCIPWHWMVFLCLFPFYLQCFISMQKIYSIDKISVIRCGQLQPVLHLMALLCTSLDQSPVWLTLPPRRGEGRRSSPPSLPSGRPLAGHIWNQLPEHCTVYITAQPW